MTYTLDANTVVDFFRDRGRVAEKWLATRPSSLALPTVVLFELEVGVLKSIHPKKGRRQIQQLVDLVELAPFGEREARSAATIRADLESRGQKIGPYDVLIAATALARGDVLVSRNVREFQKIDGLRVESWF